MLKYGNAFGKSELLQHLIRQPFGLPPSPQGEGFGAVHPLGQRPIRVLVTFSKSSLLPAKKRHTEDPCAGNYDIAKCALSNGAPLSVHPYVFTYNAQCFIFRGSLP